MGGVLHKFYFMRVPCGDKGSESLHPMVNRRRGYTSLSIHLWTKSRFLEQRGETPAWTLCFHFANNIYDLAEHVKCIQLGLEPPFRVHMHDTIWCLPAGLKTPEEFHAPRGWSPVSTVPSRRGISCAKELVEYIEETITGEPHTCAGYPGPRDPLCTAYKGEIRVLIVASPSEFLDHDRDTHPPPEWVINYVKSRFLHGIKTHWCRGAPLGTFELKFKSFG